MIYRRYKLKAKSLVLLAVGLLFFIVLLRGYILLARAMRQNGLTPTSLARLVFDSGAPLKVTGGRTNILLLGIGGGTHDGADLTDTIIVLSLNNKTHAMALISIPRDLWSDELKDKINSAYHYGEIKKKGGGLVLSKASMEDVVGLPVHYGVVVDFSGFKKVIDLVGGVTITVPKAFDDPDYPIAGKENDDCNGDPLFRCRYETLHFDAGAQNMNGDRALKYVRSRHADGNQGSDFARSKRQQDLLIALKQKFTNPAAWSSPQKVSELLHAIDDATDSDMNAGEFLTVGKFIAQTKQADIQKISIEKELTNPPLSWYGGKYVLVPTTDYDQIHATIASQLK
jgi:LCP family protein required for cell wall assembly